MDGIRMTAAALCVTAVITAVLFMLLPSEKYRSIMKYTVSLFFLCGLIAPFVGGDFSFSFTLPEMEPESRKEETVQAAETYFIGVVEERISASLEERLAVRGADGLKIEAAIHMEEDGRISIDRIIVWNVSEENRAAVSAMMKEETGIMPEIAADASEKRGSYGTS